MFLVLLFSTPNFLRRILLGLYFAGIVLMSLLPPKAMPSVPLFYGADKLIHFCMYAGFSWLAMWAINSTNKRKSAISIFLVLAVFGTGMEVIQAAMKSGRSFSYGDILSNIAGTIIGILFFLILFRMYRRYRFS